MVSNKVSKENIRRVGFESQRKLSELLINKAFGLVLIVVIPLGIFMYVGQVTGGPNIFQGLPKIQLFKNDEELDFQPEVAAETTSTQEFSVFEDKLEPVYEDPKKLVISSVNIKINVVPVGVDNEGYMKTPPDWVSGGWYKKSALTGERGNLIINAHYDDSFGRPAAFWNLKNVKVGDTVLLIDKYERVYTYSVTESFHVNIDDPNKLDILQSGDEAELTLITCGGVWIPGQSTYNQRLVVKAKLDKALEKSTGSEENSSVQ